MGFNLGFKGLNSVERALLGEQEYRWTTDKRCGPCSVFGIATGYWLDGPGIESR